MAKLSAYSDFAAAITSIGAVTPTTLDIDTASNVATAVTVTANILLRHRGHLLTKTSSGTITFAGLGLEDPMSRVALFANFAAGNVSWSSSTAYPSDISVELWDTGDSSVSTRLARANAAFSATQAVTCHLFPRTVTASVTMLAKHSVYSHAGDYPSTKAPESIYGYLASFIMSSNSCFSSEPGAIHYESTALDPTNAIQHQRIVHCVTGADNVIIENNHFKGTSGAVFNGADTTVLFDGASNSFIRNNWFDDVHAFAVSMNQLGLTSAACYNCEISGNLVTTTVAGGGSMAQSFAIVSGKLIRIVNNHYIGKNSGSNFAVVDIEPNFPQQVLEDIQIEDNTFDVREATLSGRVVAILGQAGDTPGIKRLRVKNNVILGADADAPFDQKLTQGIAVNGCLDLEISGNSVCAATYGSIVVVQSYRGDVYNNRCYGSYPTLVNSGTRDIDFYDNSFDKPWYAQTRFYEGEFLYPFTGSGTTATLIFTGADEALRGRAYPFYAEHDIPAMRWNGALYKVQSVNQNPGFGLPLTIAVDTTLLNAAQISMTTANFNHGFDRIDVGNSYVNGAAILLSSTTPTYPTGLAFGIYFVTNRDATTGYFQLAASRADALAATPVVVPFSSVGDATATYVLTPVLETLWINSVYRNNTPFDVRASVMDSKSILTKGTVTLDFSSVAANTVATQTFTLDGTTGLGGIVTTDSIFINFPTTLAGFKILNYWISAAGVLSVRCENSTGSAIDPSSMVCPYSLDR